MMNTVPQSNIYLVFISKNYTNDLHICGRCKVQYTSLSMFLKHKETCKENVKEISQPNSKMEIDSLIEIGSLEPFTDPIEKDQNHLSLLNNLLSKDHSQLRQFKIENLEEQVIGVNQRENSLCANNNVIQSKLELSSESKRTLQNDEEDIATLLANQLSSETVTDDINTEIEPQHIETPLEIQQQKDKKDENKAMYRGKMRKLFKCQVEGCVYKTLLRKDIERHSRVHTGERPFKCFICGKAFNRTDKLLLHQRIHTGDKRYKCTKCDYASVYSGSLIKHLRVHNGERPFKCQLCSYRARDSSQLTVHFRTHTGDSPFICTNNKCKAAFKTSSDLKRHMLVHSEEKPHSCTYCPYKSTLKRYLQIHIQSQHPNGELREYKCNLCSNFVSSTSRKLKNHIKKHHGSSEEKVNTENGLEEDSSNEGENVDNQESYKRRKRKTRKRTDKIPIGVMNKAYDCKLCDASFVCQDSLATHQRYHNKIEVESKQSDVIQRNCDFNPKFKPEEGIVSNIKEETFNGELNIPENCVVDNSFNDSLRNAEILASLNSTQGIGNIRQYVMIAPETIQNVYNSEEYVLVQN